MITLGLFQRPHGVEFCPLSQCVCLFQNAGRHCVFLATTKSFNTKCSPEILVIHRPAQVAYESRRAFRVPVFREEGLQVEIAGGEGENWKVEVVDISLTGALVEFPGEDVPELVTGRQLRVELRFEDLIVELRAEVRRRYGKRYGLFFTDVLEGENLEPPDELAKLLRRLEELWIK
jgi:hypothetical protein